MKNQLVFFDVECYKNYFLIIFKSHTSEEPIIIYEKHNNLITDRSCNNRAVSDIMSNNITVGFNSFKYDITMVYYALEGYNNQQLFSMSNHIINDKNSYKTINDVNSRISKIWNHIDIKPIPQGLPASLKMFGARFHSSKLQDLPFNIDLEVDNNMAKTLRDYCQNDIKVTIELYNQIKERLKLRIDLSKIYNTDLRSKSDAKIADILITNELKIYKTKHKVPTFIKYTPPKNIFFKTNNLKKLLEDLNSTNFPIEQKEGKMYGKIVKHRSFSVDINNKKYVVGVGGLHSTQKKVKYLEDEEHFIVDVDVTSYYPSMIINYGFYPDKLGLKFIELFKRFYHDRLKAKKDNNKVIADGYKIVLNGTFGKLGDYYSILYHPSSLLQITLSGQLFVLMLIERLEGLGFDVISANTDGLTIRGKRVQLDYFNKVLKSWENHTKLNLESEFYKAIYYDCVNSYLAITTDDKFKGKGICADIDLSKNPQATVCIKAIKNYLLHGIDIEDTILENKSDIKQYLKVIKVENGGVYKNEYLGRVVRWYYSIDGDCISCSVTGKKVAESEGGKPLMELSQVDNINDIDYSRYFEYTRNIMARLGIIDRIKMKRYKKVNVLRNQIRLF